MRLTASAMVAILVSPREVSFSKHSSIPNHIRQISPDFVCYNASSPVGKRADGGPDEAMTLTNERRAEKRLTSLNGYDRSPRALMDRFLAEELWRRPRYAWHRFWGDMSPFPRTMRRVWDFAAGDADYAA